MLRFTCRVFGTFKNTSDRETVYAWFTFSHWLLYANSAANPIIYNFLSGKFLIVVVWVLFLPPPGGQSKNRTDFLACVAHAYTNIKVNLFVAVKCK